MIFCGDIALPHVGALKLENIPERLKNRCWIPNLEGSLLEGKNCSTLAPTGVYNNFEAIAELKNSIQLKAVNLANNHILNYESIENTKVLLDKLGIGYFGAGNDLAQASMPLPIEENGAK